MSQLVYYVSLPCAKRVHWRMSFWQQPHEVKNYPVLILENSYFRKEGLERSYLSPKSCSWIYQTKILDRATPDFEHFVKICQGVILTFSCWKLTGTDRWTDSKGRRFKGEWRQQTDGTGRLCLKYFLWIPTQGRSVAVFPSPPYLR